MIKLNQKDYANWHKYYWQYQYNLAFYYYIPLLKKWGVNFNNAKILDIGCGSGGFTSACVDSGAVCTGIEIKKLSSRIDPPNFRYVIQDIVKEGIDNLINNYDLIILRDVIEHIENKQEFLKAVKKLGTKKTLLFITFPPYYSPFGLHQQRILKFPLKTIPFLGWLPDILLYLLLFRESKETKTKIRDIKKSKMTIRNFKRLLKVLNLTIKHELYYYIRPSHTIRYGWKTRMSKLGNVPIISETLISGTAYLIGQNEII